MSQFNLSIKPAQTEITLKPSAIFTQAYEIKNNSTETLLLSTSVSSWIPADNTGAVTYLDNSDSPLIFSLSNSDLKLGQDFLLNPGQKKQLILKVKNPSSDEKDYYLTFFINQKSLNNNLNGQQNLAKIGSHLLISTTSQDNLTSNQQISQFSMKPNIKDIFSPLKITGEIFNHAQHYSQINGQITINRNNQPFFQQNLFPYTITNSNSRLVHCLNSENQATVCQLPFPLWPGKYTGTINLIGNSSKYEYSFQFFVFPYSIIITILCLFLFFSFLLKKKHS